MADLDDKMEGEYDFSAGVRGKYAANYAEGSNVVVLSPEVSSFFKTSEEVNAALKRLLEAEKRTADAV